MTTITIVRGNKNFILDFTIYDSDNLIVDLYGVSKIVLKFKKYEDGTVQTIDGKVIDPDKGEVQFLVKEEFKDLVGEYKAEIEITYASGEVITAPNILIKVILNIA